MNYFAHAHPHLDAAEPDAYFLAGLAVPDWLGVAARRTKCRSKHAEPFFTDSDPRVAALARGVARHHADDAWFHETRAFTEASLGFSKAIRERFGEGDSDGERLRPWFLGHLLVELLLDAELIAAAPGRLDAYYRLMATVDADLVAHSVERMSGRSPGRLAEFIPRFCEVRFLADYADDQPLCRRVDQVMQRVRLARLPAGFTELLPAFRVEIADRADGLLSPDSARTPGDAGP